MDKSELISRMMKKYKRVILKDDGHKILALPFRLYDDGERYYITENRERQGNVEIFSTANEDEAYDFFWKLLEEYK